MARKLAILVLLMAAFGLGGFVTYSLMSRQSAMLHRDMAGNVPINLKVDPKPISDPGAIAQAAARVDPSVVTIDTLYRPNVVYDDGDSLRFGPSQQEAPLGTGSGVILTPDGLIVTNNHVIRNASQIQVTLSDGRHLKGQVLGSDEQSDLAVVKVDASNLPAATLGDSDKLRVGEWVVAVGDPLRVGTTVTAGIISALRKNQTSSGAGSSLSSYIQTDAAINPGNSGGALADIEGRLIGINTAIVSPNGGNIGIGLAIPINTVRALIPQLVQHRRIQRAWLGVATVPLNDDVRDSLSAPGDLQGVVVEKVEQDSPAQMIDMQPGDVIEQVDGQAVTSLDLLPAIVQKAAVGDRLSLHIWRAGQDINMQVTLQERPAQTSPQE